MSGVFLDKAMTKQEGPFEWVYPSGKLKSRTVFMNGRPIDEEIHYYEGGQIDTYIRCDNSGKQLETKYYREDGSESAFFHAEFPGGTAEMYRFIGENTKYPKSVRRCGIEGKVFVTFSVDTTGKLYRIPVLASPDDALSEEATRVVKAIPNWKAAERDGVKVAIKYNLPINFMMP